MGRIVVLVIASDPYAASCPSVWHVPPPSVTLYSHPHVWGQMEVLTLICRVESAWGVWTKALTLV